MRRSHLFSVVLAVLVSPGLAVAQTQPDPSATAEAGAPGEAATQDLSWEQFDDPDFDPGASAAVEGSSPAAVEASGEAGLEGTTAVADSASSGAAEQMGAASSSPPHGIVLGPEGVDDQGRKGRLHTVVTGNTLWDLSAAYLGTPWVWPSVWIDNDDIDNPHLIMPGDKIWITANEMRVVSDAEAESFLAPEVVDETVADSEVFEMDPGAGDVLAAFDGESDEPSTLDAFPVAVTGPTAQMAAGRQITVSRRAAMGFVSADRMTGASSIVDSPSEKVFLSAGDEVYLGLGEGDVEVGDRFTIFQTVEDVRDPETHRVLGHHVNVLGWVEVKELTGDTSIGEIRMSYSEIERGERIMPREELPRHVTMQTTPDAIEGAVVFLPSERTTMADGGYVYLNRGEFHGVEVGSELEVYERGAIRTDTTRRVDVQTPSRAVATLVVVSVEEDSSVAFVLSAKRELEVGDAVRPALPKVAAR